MRTPAPGEKPRPGSAPEFTGAPGVVPAHGGAQGGVELLLLVALQVEGLQGAHGPVEQGVVEQHLHDGQQSLLRAPHHLQGLLTAPARRSCGPGQLLPPGFLPGASAYLLKMPSTPATPMPSTMSLVSLKGTVSGVGRVLPCSKATPGSQNTEVCRHAWQPEAPRRASYLSRCGPARRSARRSECC